LGGSSEAETAFSAAGPSRAGPSRLSWEKKWRGRKVYKPVNRKGFSPSPLRGERAGVRGGLIEPRLECSRRPQLAPHRAACGRRNSSGFRREGPIDEIGKKRVREELFKVIEYQMRKGNPKETKQTFDRLRAAGYSRKETMRLLACVLIVELNEMVRDKRTYDEAIYVNKLILLPEMPWSDEPEDCT
jgi:hypothetical protein